MKDAIAWLRADIARMERELVDGTARSRTSNIKEGALQVRRLAMLVAAYPECA